MLDNPSDLAIVLLLLGLLCGGLIGWLIGKIFLTKSHLSRRFVNINYVKKTDFERLQQQSLDLRDEVKEKEIQHLQFVREIAIADQENKQLKDKLAQQEWDAAEWHRKSIAEFENLANRIFEEKSQRFSNHNLSQLSGILLPLKERINAFEQQAAKRYLDETKDRVSLKKEIEQLRELNMKLSQDANNLVTALKGESKVQGDWGEMQLELLLQRAGLLKDIHYQAQVSFRDASGRQKRPDFVINLPESKHLVIDSKVSLRDYEKYFNAETDPLRKQYLKAHVTAIRQHIKNLASKNYQQLYQINSPDYLLLYIPMEAAFSVALQEDSKLFLDALDLNIVMVTNSTLLATLRTVSYIWKQEKQKNSVLEIARQSGLLYDKFCSFVEDLQTIGHRLDQASSSFHKAMNKLTEAERKGDTLIGKAEKIRELGAKTSKNLPDGLLNKMPD